MNLQHVADFIDLVSNPDKYKEILKQLQDEQERLNVCIENVGKASELESLREGVLSKEKRLEKEYQDKVDALEKERTILQTSVKKKADSLQKKEDLLEEKVKEASDKLAEADAKLTASVAKEAELVAKESVLAAKEVELSALILEYTDKIDKIKSVLG